MFLFATSPQAIVLLGELVSIRVLLFGAHVARIHDGIHGCGSINEIEINISEINTALCFLDLSDTIPQNGAPSICPTNLVPVIIPASVLVSPTSTKNTLRKG